MKIFNLLKIVLGLGIILYLYTTIGIDRIWLEISQLNPSYIVPILFVLGLSFVIATLNILIFIRAIGKNVAFSQLLKYYIISWSMGLVVPGKIGEFSIVPLLSKKNVKIGEGTAISILDKVITVFVLSIVSAFGLIFIFDLPDTPILLLVLIIISVAPVLIIRSEAVRQIIRKKILRKYEKKFIGFSKVFFSLIKNKATLLNTILTGFKWFLSSATLWLFFLSLETHLSLVLVFFVSAITTIVSLVPITISGLGIREGMALYLFGMMGVAESTVASVYFLFLILNYLIASFVFLTIKMEKNDEKNPAIS